MTISPLYQYLDAHKLNLIVTKQKGKSIISTDHRERGSILITSQPLAIVSVSDDYCHHCLRQSHYTTLQRCSRCKAAYFCGMDCFKLAWIHYHRYVCGDKVDHRTADEELLERMVCRLIHYKQQYAHIIQQLSELADKVLQRPYLRQPATHYGISHDDLIRLQSQFQCNAMSVEDEHLFVVGEGIYPVASFFNHSCRPNAAAVFDGSLLIIKAIEPIRSGEEITLAYIDIGRSRGYRQRNLRDRYFFTCDCVRCNDQGWLRLLDRMRRRRRKNTDQLDTLRQHIDHWDLLTLSRQYDRLKNIHPDPSQPLTLGTFTHHMLQLFTPYIWSVTILTKAMETCLSFPVDSHHTSIIPSTSTRGMASIPVFRISTLTGVQRLFYESMSNQHWPFAVKCGLYILIQYCFLYPPYHPMMAHHLIMLAKSGWNFIVQDRIREKVYARGVRRWIALAKETAKYSFGIHGCHYKEAVSLEVLFRKEHQLVLG
ncbi:uncharacterized protein BX664DRAFT_290861 [Halteromyces radiatus]|uniref:uncharacterized protein n=1 Tax=Halteromyces radiatus TaxID=101107 RepID=UPI00221FB6F1|nr:uncharacterized protein BX664DRAFT_290861 [Halteromyces radiatus]KAI8096151.1 hypothetical protein BX664DRAFT_290861 [Halteromyces radiatus]